jgi:hypothetical protein
LANVLQIKNRTKINSENDKKSNTKEVTNNIFEYIVNESCVVEEERAQSMYVDMRKVFASLKKRALYLLISTEGVNNVYNLG